jgi:hypothetical protein
MYKSQQAQDCQDFIRSRQVLGRRKLNLRRAMPVLYNEHDHLTVIKTSPT